MSQHLPSPAPSPFPGGPGANPPRDAAAVRTELETQLKRLIQDLFELEVCAGSVEPGKEDVVPQYLAKVNAGLVELTKLAPQVTDSVPKSIVEHVDRYKNPHLYTKTMLSRATGENQYALGRILGLESFRSQLADQLGEAFPGVPLPERRHKPVGVDADGEAEGGEDGEAGTETRNGPGEDGLSSTAEGGAPIADGALGEQQQADGALGAERGTGANDVPVADGTADPGAGTTAHDTSRVPDGGSEEPPLGQDDRMQEGA